MDPDRNPNHPQNLMDWSLARDTPQIKSGRNQIVNPDFGSEI